MKQFHSLKACAAHALKMACLFAIAFLLMQPVMAQSAGDKSSGDITKTSAARSWLDVHPNSDRQYITIGHPAAASDARLTLVDTNDKVLRQVDVSKNSLQTKLKIEGLAAGTYKIVWRDGEKTIDQPLLML